MDILENPIFKVGDKVLIDGDLKSKINHNHLDIVKEMIQYKNKIATIVGTANCNSYIIDIDGCKWMWDYRLLKKVNE